MPKNVYSADQLAVLNDFFATTSQKPSSIQLEQLTTVLRQVPGKQIDGANQIKFWFTRKRFALGEKRQMEVLDSKLGRGENDPNSSMQHNAKCKSSKHWTPFQSQYVENYFKQISRKPSLEEIADIAVKVEKPVIMVKKWFTYRRSQDNQKGPRNRTGRYKWHDASLQLHETQPTLLSKPNQPYSPSSVASSSLDLSGLLAHSAAMPAATTNGLPNLSQSSLSRDAASLPSTANDSTDTLNTSDTTAFAETLLKTAFPESSATEQSSPLEQALKALISKNKKEEAPELPYLSDDHIEILAGIRHDWKAEPPNSEIELMATQLSISIDAVNAFFDNPDYYTDRLQKPSQSTLTIDDSNDEDSQMVIDDTDNEDLPPPTENHSTAASSTQSISRVVTPLTVANVTTNPTLVTQNGRVTPVQLNMLSPNSVNGVISVNPNAIVDLAAPTVSSSGPITLSLPPNMGPNVKLVKLAPQNLSKIIISNGNMSSMTPVQMSALTGSEAVAMQGQSGMQGCLQGRSMSNIQTLPVTTMPVTSIPSSCLANNKTIVLSNDVLQTLQSTAAGNVRSTDTTRLDAHATPAMQKEIADLRSIVQEQATQLQNLQRYCAGLEERLVQLEDNTIGSDGTQETLPESE